MQGLNALKLVSSDLDAIELPPLAHPKFPELSEDDQRRLLILSGGKLYAYSVIAHVRTVLRALVGLGQSDNVPTAHIVSRHVFEWAAHVCYVTEQLKVHIANRDWDTAKELLDKVIIGTKWVKEHGQKYGRNELFDFVDLPDNIRIRHPLASYEAYVKANFGDDTDDHYGLLAEHSHPNSACLMQYQRYTADSVGFVEPSYGSPLPKVNWCMLDMMTFLDDLLGVCGERTIRPQIEAIKLRVLELSSGKSRG